MMMKSLQKTGRAAATALAITGLVLLSSAVPAAAHDDDDHGCTRYARVSCQNDNDYSYQCFEDRYYACLDFFHGASASAADYLREDRAAA